jgi:hypothetical protein
LKDYNDIASDVESLKRNMVDTDFNNLFNERVKFMAAVNAMNATLELATALQSGVREMDIKMHAQIQACETAAWLEYVPMIIMGLNDFYNPESQKNGKEMLMNVVGNLTKTVLYMHHLYPEFTCIEDVLINMLSYAEEWSTRSPEERGKIDLDWMFSVDQVYSSNEHDLNHALLCH